MLSLGETRLQLDHNGPSGSPTLYTDLQQRSGEHWFRLSAVRHRRDHVSGQPYVSPSSAIETRCVAASPHPRLHTRTHMSGLCIVK